jgi:response regulator RpfG family c-di-GMP phosphodiesterase
MIAGPKHIESVLIIAADTELLTFLSWELGGTYPVLPCETCARAIKVAESAKPDLILLHLPPTRDRQLLKAVNDFTSHPIVSQTPVILISRLRPSSLIVSKYVDKRRVAAHLSKTVPAELLRTEVKKVLMSSCKIDAA